MTILVVDDDAAAREYTRGLLEDAGYSVSEAADGAAALERVWKAMPECIVLDLVMPGLSGFDTLRTLRKEHRFVSGRRTDQHGWRRDPDIRDQDQQSKRLRDKSGTRRPGARLGLARTAADEVVSRES